MTIHRVLRRSDNRKSLGATVLPDGTHLIEHDGLSIPVTVKGNEVTLHIGQASGLIGIGHIYVTPDFTTVGELQDGRVKDVTIEPGLGRSNIALDIYGLNTDLVIERRRDMVAPSRRRVEG